MLDRRLLAAVVLVLALPPAAASARTRVVRVSPLDASGHVRSGLRVAHSARGTCHPFSEAVPGAYRCFGDDNLIRDPCWRAGARTAICLLRPWARTVTRMHVRGGLAAPAPGRTRLPWGVKLRDGERCLLMQGASDVVHGKRVNYGCSRTSFLLGTPSRRHSSWRIQRARLTGGRFVAGRRAVVKTAWFGKAR